VNGAPFGDLEQSLALLVVQIPIELKVPFNAVKAYLLCLTLAAILCMDS
jgi:hypothetical protein